MWKKSDLLNMTIFVISPFMAIPTILLGIINKSKFSLQLLVLLFGVVSYIYIPNLSDDRARYFEFYRDFSDSSFLELFGYLMLTGQDFILQCMFYFASQISLPAQYVFAFTTIITMSLIFSVYYKITKNQGVTTVELRSFSFLILCCSIPYIDLLSGTRFMFAASFVLMGFYMGLVERKFFSLLLLLVAAFIHFSTLVFIPIFIVLFVFPNNDKFYKIVFLISLLFMLIPQEVINSIFNTFGFSGGLGAKKEAYLEGEDFVKKALEESYLSRIGNFLNLLWIFGNYFYLILTNNRNDVLRRMVLFTATVINVFYSVPTVFFRYAIILKFLFVFVLIFDLYKYKKKLPAYGFVAILSCLWFLQVIGGLPNIVSTFSKKENFFLASILADAPMSEKDFLE
ncbi:EpsG family protein [Flavobacterium sp. WG21]|uniref:EpsG family protein n=1 Tax=Flavobacterium sp. WG21 TaxID=1229487 RepID=UPI000346382A|nr:EpsG family protein [Flavobacterium sp. WG21]